MDGFLVLAQFDATTKTYLCSLSDNKQCYSLGPIIGPLSSQSRLVQMLINRDELISGVI